jgi:DNA-binding CsgD family transcriptional regulator
MRLDRVEGSAANVPAIDAITPEAVVDGTLTRLGRLPSEARAVAEAVALLEPNAELRWIAEVTNFDIDVVAAAADSLLELGMLRSVEPCRYEHPILRSAVESEMAPARRGRLHLKAARAFSAAGMTVESVAAHLMLTPPSGEAFIVSTLLQAARQATARGAPGSTVSYLRRALAERATAGDSRELLLLLGTAETRLKAPEAMDHLRAALALAEHPDDAALTAVRLGQALSQSGAIEEAYDVVSQVVDRTDGHESESVLELQTFMLALAGPAGKIVETAERAAELDARTARGRASSEAAQASLALRDLVAGAPKQRVRERAESALASRAHHLGTSTAVAGSGTEAPGMALLWIDDLDRAEQLFTAAIKHASQMGKMSSFENYSALRGFTMHRRGDLADAAADIEPVLAAAAQGQSPGLATLIALITQVLLLTDHGQPDAAEALAGYAPILPALERLPIVALLRHAHAGSQLAQRKFGAAATMLTRVGEICDANAIHSPAMFPWRSDLALALAGTDRHQEGVELARTELRLAETSDVDRARGRALRVLGLLQGGPCGLERLDAAVQAFGRSPGRLELGWANYEHGAALRRARRRRDARAPLDRALDLALGCGAERLAKSCNEELQALGARPRSVMLTGDASLTPSERRVCRLAAEGLKNAEIAQALFVSLKTIETHLRSSYRKLDITSRVELPQTLTQSM